MKGETSTKKFTYFPLASIVTTPTPFVIDIVTLPFRLAYHIIHNAIAANGVPPHVLVIKHDRSRTKQIQPLNTTLLRSH